MNLKAAIYEFLHVNSKLKVILIELINNLYYFWAIKIFPQPSFTIANVIPKRVLID